MNFAPKIPKLNLKRLITSPGALLRVPLLVALLFAVGSSAYFYGQYQEALKTSPEAREITKIVDEVSKFMELPQDEVPKLATIDDKTKLENTPFFQKAEDGDKVLIYENLKKAILYRPSTGKIIDVAPLLSSDQGVPTEAPKPAEELQPNQTPETPQTPELVDLALEIYFYNGTTTEGVTAPIIELIQANFPEARITGKAPARRKDYGDTIVVDINGVYPEGAQEIATFLNAVVSELPVGEIKPESDLLIIVGRKKEETSTPTPTE